MRCCVEKTGSASTIGSRHLSFTDRSVYHNSSKSNLVSSSNAKSRTNDKTASNANNNIGKDNSKTVNNKSSNAYQTNKSQQEVKQQLNESKKENPAFWNDLNQLDIDKLIQSLDEEGKVDLLRKKLSVYLKSKKLNSTSVFDDTLTETTNPLNDPSIKRQKVCEFFFNF